MEEIQTFTIQLNGSCNSYRLNADGSLSVSGNVVVFSAMGLEVQNIEVTFKGEVHYTKIDWRRNTQPATGVIFNLKQNVIESNGKTFTSLAPGIKYFPFQFQLIPKRSLPSSSQNIVYLLKAKMTSRKGTSTAEASLPINLYNPPVLKPKDMRKLHVRKNQATSINCCCIQITDAVEIEAIINKTSLIIGTDAKLDLRLVVHNFTNRELTPQVSFERLTTGNDSASTVLSRMTADPVEQNTGNNILDFEIKAYSKDLTETIDSLRSLSVKYVLKVRLKGSALKLNIPIKVGIHDIEPAIPTLQHGLTSSVSAGANLLNVDRTHSIDDELGSVGEDATQL